MLKSIYYRYKSCASFSVRWARFGVLSFFVGNLFKVLEPPILVISYPRSGSSWVGEIMGSANNSMYLREPINQSYQNYGLEGRGAIFKINHKEPPVAYKRFADMAFRGIPIFTNQGKVRFIIHKRIMSAKTFIKFLKRLIKDANQKIFLILDNLCVHHAYVVRDWLENHKDEIELFFIPSYSSEFNPDEYLNCDLKAGVHSGVLSRTKDHMKNKAISHLRMLQKKPKRVLNIQKLLMQHY